MGLNKKFISLVTLLFVLIGILPVLSSKSDHYTEKNTATDTYAENEVVSEGEDTTDASKEEYTTSLNIGEVASNKITINWDKIDQIVGYTLYRATSEDGTYIEIYTIADKEVTTYTDNNLTPGTNYYYKIKTFTTYDDNQEYGPDSDIVTATTSIEVPILTLEPYNDSCVKVSWVCNTEVDGYTLYRATSEDGQYDDIDEVDNPSYTYYIDKNVDYDETYYYKIRGYKYTNGEKVYGDYSEIKKIIIQ